MLYDQVIALLVYFWLARAEWTLLHTHARDTFANREPEALVRQGSSTDFVWVGVVGQVVGSSVAPWLQTTTHALASPPKICAFAAIGVATASLIEQLLALTPSRAAALVHVSAGGVPFCKFEYDPCVCVTVATPDICQLTVSLLCSGRGCATRTVHQPNHDKPCVERLMTIAKVDDFTVKQESLSLVVHHKNENGT